MNRLPFSLLSALLGSAELLASSLRRPFLRRWACRIRRSAAIACRLFIPILQRVIRDKICIVLVDVNLTIFLQKLSHY